MGPATPADRGYEGGFLARLMLKDLKLAQAAAKASGAQTPMGEHAELIYAEFESQGFGDKDFSAVLLWFRGHLLQAADISISRAPTAAPTSRR